MEKSLGLSKRIPRSAVEHKKNLEPTTPSLTPQGTVNRQCVSLVRGRKGISRYTEPMALRRGNAAPTRQDRWVNGLRCGRVSLEGAVAPIAPV